MVRQDCLRRRNQIDLPEFYPGSIVAVTYADKYAANKTLSLVSITKQCDVHTLRFPYSAV